MMDERKCCPNCSQLYHLKSLSPSPKGNIPLFLSCGHSMCENCIRNIVKFLEPIECKICHCDMELHASEMEKLTQNKIKLYQLFPVNFHMLGELTLQLMERNPESNTYKAEEDCFIDLQALLKSADSSQGECLECHNPTSKLCQQCVTVLCDTCFTKTHKNFVIFKNHVLKNIASVMESIHCKLHENKPLDYYCKDCLKSICMDCLMVGGEKSCKNHNVVSMQEVNNGFLENLIDMTPKIDETFRRLTKTAVDIGQLLYNIENETGAVSELTHITSNIEQHFSKLCSIVQKHKREIIDRIMKLKFSERESLLKAKNDVSNSIQKAKRVLDTVNFSSDPNNLKQLNLSLVLEDAKQVLETPWYLNRDDSDKNPLKVAVNEDICALINDYIHLEGNCNSIYKLCSPEELGDDVEIPPAPSIPVYPPELPKDVRQSKKPMVEKPKAEKDNSKTLTFYKFAPKYRSKSDSVTSLNSGSSDSSQISYITHGDGYQKPVVQQVMPFAESQHPKQLNEGTQELIYISHIVNPHNFYVQRACHQGLVKEMLREFRNAVSLPKPSISHVAEGKTYLAFNKADNMWQRCRVIGIDRRDIDRPIFNVFCIDFGSIETVSIDRLRLLPPARLQTPYPLAINCSLANCEPKTAAWTSDDSFLIQNIIDNRQAVIHVRRIHSTSNYTVQYECDVTTFEDGVSLAHALVFHDRAKMPNPKVPYPDTPGMREKPKIFMGNNDYKPKSTEEVYITHIVSPDNFSVRKRHLQSVYEKLCENLDQEYNLAVNSGYIYLPEIGMVCAVNVEKHRQQGAGGGGWARGVVAALPGRARARVRLPDSGHVLLVHWGSLRHMHTRFTTLGALATECHLAGVTPLNKKWSPGSVTLLQKFEDRLLELHVEDSRKGSIGVTLYDKNDEENIICVNQEMIKYKFAVTIGLFKFHTSNDVEDQVFTNKSPLSDTNSHSKPNSDNKKHLKIESPTINEKDLEAKDKGPLRLEAKILHYQSPSLIYVSLVHQQKIFSELFEKIQKYYSKKKTLGKEDWKAGDRCCTVCNQSQTWRRAVIVELEDNNAKVFYSDFACVETIPISGLRELTPELALTGDAAIKCHLCGVIPAVGEDWPSITKEYLKELLDAYKRVFITKLGNFKDTSMPIEIWVYHTIQGGALEPNKSEWRCLNNKIIEQGLGVPDKSHEVVGNAETSAGDDEMLSFLNVKGSVREWLQLEPLPTNPEITMSNSERNSNVSTPIEYLDTHDTNEDLKSESSNVMFISDWLPPEPLPYNEFTATPTYIDNDGVLYLHDVSQQDTLELIRNALNARFKNPDPKAKYIKWRVGEPCVALFFLDNQFYRGRVLEVNEEASTCLIHYIDYGNEEYCSFSNLRKNIVLHQIPVQAHKCMINRIRPVGKHWDRQTLDYIHKSIVEKKCYVKVAGEKVGDLIPIELKYDKLWINDHLVDFELAVYTDGSKAVVRKFAPPTSSKKLVEPTMTESDSGPDYIVEEEQESARLSSSRDTFDDSLVKGKDWNEILDDDEKGTVVEDKYITYPRTSDELFRCNITVINDTKTLELNVIHNDVTNEIYEQMFKDLQLEGENMAPLNGIFEDKACLAIFHEDKMWYRASILQYSETENKIKVRYVDYGNVEIIPLTDVREIDEKWIKLPPATVAARLCGVQLNPNTDMDIITQEYTDTFLDKGPFNAKIINYFDSLPEVELTDDDGVLVYEKLIQKGVFLKCEPDVD